MSDIALQTRCAFEGLLASIPNPSVAPGIILTPRDDLALATIIARRGQRSALAARVDALFGLALPAGPKRVAAGPVALIGMGPDQWLAVEDASRDPQTFAADLAAALAGIASVSDQSDARATIRIAGPHARDVLAKGWPIDLHPRAFRPGDAALSSIALIGAHLWQIDEAPTYDIAVFRSMAASFVDWLLTSAAQYGVAAMS